MRCALCLTAVLLAGCKKETPSPPVRPVLSIIVAPKAERTFIFSGTVEPRYKANLAFRVLGRLIARNVEIGDPVKTGQEVAQVDNVSLILAVRSAIADVSSARARLTNSTGVEARQRYLVGRNASPQAQLDTAQATQESAAATAQRAEANLAKAEEQLTYLKLLSEMDGVVTAVGAQVGQVVAAGSTVLTVARPDVREAAVDVPEDVAAALQPGKAFAVGLQLLPEIHMQGEVREIGPQLDASTRTRRVLISLPDANELFRLGATITATLSVSTAPRAELPRSALLEKNGKSFVWVVDPNTTTVALREIMVAGDDPVMQVTDGLNGGMRVVTAGVHSLSDGQRVKLLGTDAQ